MEHLSIGETAKLLGVSVSTLRRWECEGKLLPAYRTVGGHRRYLWQDIQQFCGQFAPELRKTIAYARVSSHDQKDDLERQAQRLEQYCTEQGFDNVTVLKDLGSGLNYHKKQFKQLLRMIALGHDQDRNNLLNFMIQAYNMHAESFGIHFSVILNITSEEI